MTQCTPGHGSSPAGVDAQNAGVGQGASEQFAIEHAGQLDIVGINGLAGGLGTAVGPGNVFSDDAVRVHGTSFCWIGCV
jgi:hypothetical protein